MYFLDKLQFVDWESDSEREDTSEFNEFEDGENAVEISDCASCASSHSSTSEERAFELPKVRMNCFKFLNFVYGIFNYIFFFFFFIPSSRITTLDF